jgi:hypothetical protein
MTEPLHPVLHYVRGMYKKFACAFILIYSKFYKNRTFARRFLRLHRE